MIFYNEIYNIFQKIHKNVKIDIDVINLTINKNNNIFKIFN
jgi:hypothetical protein